MKLSFLIVVTASACTITRVEVGSSEPGVDAGAQGDHPPYTVNCGMPDGPAHSYATADEAAQLLTATWIYCSGDVLDGSTQVGIAFGADQIFHDLEDLGSGTYVELAGTSTNTWAVASAPVELLVTTEFSGNHLDEVWSPTFEDSPRKLLVTKAGASEPSIYAIAP
jgi:hypothetical protein